MNRDFYTPAGPFLYTAPDSGGAGPGSSGSGGSGSGGGGMDCLQPMLMRCPPPPVGPFHYLISEQAKSLVALQELQHEVGALLEFRDLVIETFPNLRTKMAVSSSIATPLLSSTSAPLIRSGAGGVRGDWEPGVRVRRRIQHHKDASDSSPSRSRSNSHSGGKQQPKSNTETTSVVQDSGFSTETSSSKETHSASSTTCPVPIQPSTSKDETPEAEDGLWGLLNMIEKRGTKLRDEVEALQDALRARNDLQQLESDFQRQLLVSESPEDIRTLRRERDILLEKLADIESENLAGRVQASRMRADLENLLAAKIDLEEQLRAAVTQKSELNTRIHDLHSQFVSGVNKSVSTSPESNKSSGSCFSGSPIGKNHHHYHHGEKPPPRRRRTSSSSRRSSDSVESSGASACANNSRDKAVNQTDNNKLATSSSLPTFEDLCRLDSVLELKDNLTKVRVPDHNKIVAILQENDPIVLQRSLLTATVNNQALKQKLDSANQLKDDLSQKLDKAREDNDDLRFQLEEKSIELEGTKAHVRVLERLQNQKLILSGETNSEVILPDSISTSEPMTPRVDQLNISMKAMTPLQLGDENNGQNSSSTESAHDQRTTPSTIETPHKRKPSRIPLPGSFVVTRSQTPKGASSLPRPNSAQSGSSLSGSKSATTTSIPGPKVSKTSRESLTGRLRNSESSSKVSNSGGPNRSASVCNKKDGLSTSRVRRINSISSRGTILTDGNDSKTNSPTKLNISPWNISSIDTENIGISDPLFPDSLDETERPTDTNSDTVFETANNFLWNYPAHNSEYFDSINSTIDECLNSTESLQRSNEALAECDSLEKHVFNREN